MTSSIGRRLLAQPPRVLAASSLMLALGQGMFTATAVIYLTRILDLSVARVGLALSAAGVAGFLISIPFGRLIDRIGARRATASLQLAKAGLTALLAVETSALSVLGIIVLLSTAIRGTQIAWQALIADVAAPSERVRVQALSRTGFNIGISAGVLIAAPVLGANSRAPFVLLLAGVAICFALAVPPIVCLPTGHRATRDQVSAATRQRPGLSFTALGLATGVLGLHASILEVALPLWVVTDTRVPRPVVSALLIINTALVVVLQLRLSKAARSVRGAAAVLTASGLVIAASCVVFLVTRGLSGWAAVALLILATTLLSIGEIWQQAASWGLAFGLAPVGGQGRHLGAFLLGSTLQDIAGPALMTLLIIRHAPGGWGVLALLLAIASATAFPLSRQAGRRAGVLGMAARAQDPRTSESEERAIQ